MKSTKLNLSKQTIANLSNQQMAHIEGGLPPVISGKSSCFLCVQTMGVSKSDMKINF